MKVTNFYRYARGALASLIWLGCSNAQAQFIGHTIQIAHVYPNTSSLFTLLGLPANFLVGPGVELNYAGAVAMDISDSTISLTIVPGVTSEPGDGSANSFDGYRFTDTLGSMAAIIGVSINASTSLPGFTANRLSFGDDYIAMNFEGLSTGASTRSVVVDVQFAPVPEVSSLALFPVGLLGIGLYFRRNSRKRS
jgi:hypothetical protein